MSTADGFYGNRFFGVAHSVVQAGVISGDVNIYAAPRDPLPLPHRWGAFPPLAHCFQRRPLSWPDDRMVVLTGLGGVGKTQLAVDLAMGVWGRREADLVAWLPARSRAEVVAGFAALAADLDGRHDPDAEAGARRLLGWLAGDRRWLLVLDDVRDPADLAGLWPPVDAAGTTVVTTRRRDAALSGPGRRTVELGCYTAEESLSYLVARLPDRVTTDGVGTLWSLAAELGHLPLALAHAAAYLAHQPLLTCEEYLNLLAGRRRTLARLLPADPPPDDYHAAVAVTWSLSVELADRLTPPGLARPTLELAALLDPDGMPRSVFTHQLSREFLSVAAGSPVDEHDAVTALGNLSRLSLLDLDSADPHRAVRTHVLVQRATREHLERADQTRFAASAMSAAGALHDLWPAVERDRDESRALRANAERLLGNAGPALWGGGLHPLLTDVGPSYFAAGQARAAAEFADRLHSLSLDHLGPHHPDTDRAHVDAVTARANLDRSAAAMARLRDVLLERLRRLPADHPDTLQTRFNLAQARGALGEAAQAARELGEVVAEHERRFGPHHPLSLTLRVGHAHWVGKAGDVAGAVRLLTELLTQHPRAADPGDPDVLGARHELATWTASAEDSAAVLGRLTEALGEEHPQVLSARNNLALQRSEAGDHAGAVAEFTDLVTDLTRSHGPRHPHTLITRTNLAQARGRTDPAAAAREMTAIAEDLAEVVGPDHPDTLTARNNAASFLGAAGDTRAARAAFERLAADRLRVQGDEHPDTIAAFHNLADARGEDGDPAAAAMLFTKVTAERERLSGVDHPQTIQARAQLARWLGRAGDARAAAATCKALAATSLRVNGPHHEDTHHWHMELAHWAGTTGDHTTAVDALAVVADSLSAHRRPDNPELLAVRANLAFWQGRAGDPGHLRALVPELARTLGADHPTTLASRHNLATVVGESGDRATATTILTALLRDMRAVHGDDHPETARVRRNLDLWSS